MIQRQLTKLKNFPKSERKQQMIYITGDTHTNFQRFSKKQRQTLPFALTPNDYVIVCGDFGLLWCKNKELEYNLEWLSQLPFTLLWVQGNHENYDMIAEYPIEVWHGGNARHIIKDKIILLERGQVFSIEDKTFFTFGGGASYDMPGGILDRKDPLYRIKKRNAKRQQLQTRILNETWWEQELPTEDEMQEGRKNLEKNKYKVDYIISHCCASSIQEKIAASLTRTVKSDSLTDYFEELEQNLQYRHWYFGHYHIHQKIDENHTVLYKEIIPIDFVDF